MKQQQSELENQPLWDEIESLIHDLQRKRQHRQLSKQQHLQFPHLYRKLCSHYALARSRGFSPALVDQLHTLVLRGHPLLYRFKGEWGWRTLQFIFSGFPRALRRQKTYFLIALLAFLLPGLLMGTACFLNDELIYSVMDESTVAQMEQNYDPANDRPGRSVERSSDTDFMMFGFYIMNNIGIGFRTFASGILFGIGSLFFLLFNGLVIGGVAGHLSRLGYHDTFWPFVSGHGSFELTAIVICGAAGLMLGHALLAPRQQTRLQALKTRALEALPLVMGAALMLLFAAFIEAFWSSSSVAIGTKYSVAAILWLVVVLYLVFMGRNDGSG
ncbi:MAG: stage II sporulation protein M [Candidatus Thiodiazotropha taylori]|nr:stage II sporulation protein M [Candidatus Thiodiazotropha taylori]MCW4246334.1 stage II sporulation protein M [Candidatus Thiodiazotropha taylori]